MDTDGGPMRPEPAHPPDEPGRRDAGATPPAPRPMTAGGILDGAFTLFRANVRAVLAVAALFTVPVNFLLTVAQRSVPGAADPLAPLTDPSLAGPVVGATTAGVTSFRMLGLQLLLDLVLVAGVAGTVSTIVTAGYLGGRLDWAAALRATAGRFLPLLGAAAMELLIVLGVVLAGSFTGGIALILLGPLGLVGVLLLTLLVILAFLTLYLVTTPAIVVERLGPVQGMRRSWRLVRPRFWWVLGLLLLAALVAVLLSVALGFPVGLALGLLGLDAWPLVTIGGTLPQLVVLPVLAGVAVLCYFDARIRHEGFDLQMTAEELERDRAARRQPAQDGDPGGGGLA